MLRWKTGLGALAAVALLAACGGGSGESAAGAGAGPLDLAQTAGSTGTTDTLAKAMADAGMSDTVGGGTELTLLAPSDEALSAYAEDLAELSAPGREEELRDFVAAHVIPAAVTTAELQAAAEAAIAAEAEAEAAGFKSAAEGDARPTIRNLLGEEIEVELAEDGLRVNGAEFSRRDVAATNGWFHECRQPLFRPNVFSIVKRLPETSILEAAVRAAGLQSTLTGKGKFTVFAPTDEAFEALLAELNLSAEQLLGDTALLTRVLSYHVLASRQLARQIDDGAFLDTVQGQAIGFDAAKKRRGTPREITLTDARGRTAKVIRADLQARNGVVHLIDRVILPADLSIVDIAAADPQFSVLVEAVQAAGLADALSAPGPSTVFAPTNDAFVRLLGDLGLTKEQLFANQTLLTQVLTYHVVAGRVYSDDLSDGLAQATLAVQPLVFRTDAPGPRIVDATGGTSKLVATDVQAANGVVHVIDRVLLPTDQNLVQLAASRPELGILVQAVQAAGLVDALSAPGPFTLFAPTDAAFTQLLAELGLNAGQLLADRDLLTRVLTYHVVPGQVLSSGIPFGQPVTTLQGGTFTIGRSLRITDETGGRSRIVATDVAASNGVVHLIDRVLLPK